MIERPLVTKPVEINFSVQKHHTFSFKQIHLPLKTTAVRRKGYFSLGIHNPVPGQLHAARRSSHGLADPACSTAHACKAGDLTISQNMPSRYSIDHLPNGLYPLIELGFDFQFAFLVRTHFFFSARGVYASILAYMGY